jgi:hypothetical protein
MLRFPLRRGGTYVIEDVVQLKFVSFRFNSAMVELSVVIPGKRHKASVKERGRIQTVYFDHKSPVNLAIGRHAQFRIDQISLRIDQLTPDGVVFTSRRPGRFRRATQGDSDASPGVFAIAWDPDLMSDDEYAELVDIVGDLVRANGGTGVRRIIEEDIGVVGAGVLQ